MNDENKTGIAPLEDDDLDNVSGGITKAKAADAKAQAHADGRTHGLPAGNLLCIHNHKYKWARSQEKTVSANAETIVYSDIKCYHANCGKTWSSFSAKSSILGYS